MEIIFEKHIPMLKISEFDKHLLPLALRQFGQSAQVDMIIEECAELILALQKLKRQRGNTSIQKIDDVRDELADVFLMVNQGALIFGTGAVQKIVDHKLARLERRLDENIS